MQDKTKGGDNVESLMARITGAASAAKAEAEKKSAPKVLIVYQGLWESIVTDACTFGFLIATAVVCSFLQTTVLQWIVGLMLIIHLFHGFNRILKKETYTIEAARAKLDELEKNFPK